MFRHLYGMNLDAMLALDIEQWRLHKAYAEKILGVDGG